MKNAYKYILYSDMSSFMFCSFTFGGQHIKCNTKMIIVQIHISQKRAPI